MAALRDIASEGYPTDYVVARVRARRARLIAALPGGPAVLRDDARYDAEVWDALLGELDWLRRQMNGRMRAVFEPVFTLFGIKTLVLVLRDKAAERQPQVERLMRHELVAADLRSALVRARDAAAAVAALGAAFAPVGGDAPTLATLYAEGGLKAFESRLMQDFLANTSAAHLHPAIRRFFERFVDLRNVMTLYKQLRWGFQDPAAFARGGTREPAWFAEVAAQGDTARLDACIAELTGDAHPAAVGEVALESRLLSWLTQRLRGEGRQGGPVELILDYVWGIYVQARNRALRLHAAGLGAAALEQELIA